MCSKTLLVLLFMFCGSNFSNGQRDKKFFRKDYHFLEATQSFYKAHTLRRNWQDAKRMCALEGASLFYPEDDAEAQAVLEYWKATQPFGEIFVGISALVAKGVYETIDGLPVEDVYHNWGSGEPNNANNNEDCVVFRKDSTYNDYPCFVNYPFFCKKTLASLEWNSPCNMSDLGYKLNEPLSRCYKFQLKPLNWTEAYAACSAQQSYLAIINSQAEADYFVALTESTPKDQVTGDFMAGAVHLGFRKVDDDGWQTVRGTSLEESGYATWGYGQPDGPPRGVDERCGSMFYNGHLNDIRCDRRCFYICEHEVETLTSQFDDRTGYDKR